MVALSGRNPGAVFSVMTKVEDYYQSDTFARIKACADQHETPFLVVDTATVGRHYDELVNAFPYASVYYAVKANPAPQIIELLRDRGASFDIASIYELDRVMNLGVGADRIRESLNNQPFFGVTSSRSTNS